MKPAIVCALLAPIALVPLFVSPAPAAAAPQTAVPGTVWEPVLLYNVTGGSFGGPVQISLVVYNNGFISFSTDNSFLGGDIVSAQTVEPAVVVALSRKLQRAGAFDLEDFHTPVGDFPLTTVTVMNGSTDSPSHSFSFNASIGPYFEIAKIVNDFVDANVDAFPNE